MLSNLGEKISFQMKTDLFAAIIRQDIAFFDEQRTGEVINRYLGAKPIYQNTENS